MACIQLEIASCTNVNGQLWFAKKIAMEFRLNLGLHMSHARSVLQPDPRRRGCALLREVHRLEQHAREKKQPWTRHGPTQER